MGNRLNRSGDLIPPYDMYDACRILARYVEWNGDLSWDFSRLNSMDIPDEFTTLIERYLKGILEEQKRKPNALVGWKIPETTLVFPWITQLFPDRKFIFWIRRSKRLNTRQPQNG